MPLSLGQYPDGQICELSLDWFMYLPKDVGLGFHLRNQSAQSQENDDTLNQNKMLTELSMNLLQGNTKILKGI